MNILFATAEAVPFCKTGGLGDVCGSLPRALEKLGHQPTIILPAFRQVFESGLPIEPTGVEFEIPIGQKQVQGRYLQSTLPRSNVPVYFVDNPSYYDRPDLYRDEEVTCQTSSRSPAGIDAGPGSKPCLTREAAHLFTQRHPSL